MYNKKVKTVCPVCDKNIDGEFVEQDKKILLKKNCSEHGEVVDLVSSDAELFKDRMSLIDHIDGGCTIDKCKEGIFRCAQHVGRKSPISFIEVTTRCNMKCPVCYADAETKGKDVPLEDINRMIDKAAQVDPQTFLILIGGEPTIRRDLFDILKKSKDKGLIRRTFIATNAITLADKEYCKKIYEAGVRRFYFAFDGTDPEACKKIRGSLRSYEAVRKALQNIRELGKAWIILSFTAVKGVNDHNLVDAVKFAIDNSDIVKRVMIAPEVFCGRITKSEDLISKRLTADCIENKLKEKLGVKVATVSITLLYILMKPLKIAGFLNMDQWMSAVPSPLCGQMGFIGLKEDGKFYSILDRLIKKDKNIFLYTAGEARRASISKNSRPFTKMLDLILS